MIVDLGRPVTFSKVVLGEYLPCGQHIERFTVSIEKHGKWKKVYAATVVGHKRICLLKKTTAQRIKITIDECRTLPTLRKLEVIERIVKNVIYIIRNRLMLIASIKAVSSYAGG